MTTKPNYKTAEDGYLYCLSNESHPHLVKIGMTAHNKTPHQRAKELSGTSVPTPFRVEFAKRVRHPYRLEQELHRLLQARGMRVNHRKEHFRMTPYEALQYFHLLDGEWSPPPSPYLMRPIRSPPPVYGRPPSRPLSPILPRSLDADHVALAPLASPQRRNQCAVAGLMLTMLVVCLLIYWVWFA